MIKKHQILLLLALIFHQSLCYTQTACVIFKSEKNKKFQISINHVKQHQNYSNNTKVNQLNGNSSYNVKIDFENDSLSLKQNIFLIDDGLTHIYRIIKKSLQLKKVIPNPSYTKTKNQLEIIFLKNETIALDTLTKDTIQKKDTAYIVPFASYYKLEDYNGKIGCPYPIKEVDQAELRGIVLRENLEESKLEKVIYAIQDMDSACVLVDQTKELLLLFKFEETRLDFAKFMRQYTFDLDNYEKLYSVFNFENSKDKLKLFIKDQ